MGKTDISFGINDAIQRHAAQFKKLHLLPVLPGNQVIRVRQTNEGDPFILPVLFKGGQRVWANRQDFHPAAFKFFIFITQARQLRATVGSHEAAQKCQYDRFAAKLR